MSSSRNLSDNTADNYDEQLGVAFTLNASESQCLDFTSLDFTAKSQFGTPSVSLDFTDLDFTRLVNLPVDLTCNLH